MGVLSGSSLSVDAAQTASGNTPDAGTISDTRVSNSIVVSGSDPPMGGSVIYSVSPNTEYYIRAYVPVSSSVFPYIHFFTSYPSLGSSASFYSNDFSRDGSFITFHFTTSSNTSFVVLSFRFNKSVTDYDTIRSFIKSASIGSALGLYLPLSNESKMNLNDSFDVSFSFSFSASGGVGQYLFTADFIDDQGNVENLYNNVSAGDYTMVLPAAGDNDTVRVTVSDYLGNTSVKNFNVDLIQHIVQQLPPPEIDVSNIPDTSISVDNGVADIIIDSWNVLPSEITALLIPVVLFSLIGWWLHK